MCQTRSFECMVLWGMLPRTNLVWFEITDSSLKINTYQKKEKKFLEF